MADRTGRRWHPHTATSEQMIVRVCSHCGQEFHIRLASRFIFCRPCWETMDGNQWIRNGMAAWRLGL